MSEVPSENIPRAFASGEAGFLDLDFSAEGQTSTEADIELTRVVKKALWSAWEAARGTEDEREVIIKLPGQSQIAIWETGTATDVLILESVEICPMDDDLTASLHGRTPEGEDQTLEFNPHTYELTTTVDMFYPGLSRDRDLIPHPLRVGAKIVQDDKHIIFEVG